MNETKYWKPSWNGNPRKLLKNLGVGGVVALVVVGIIFLLVFIIIIRPSYALICKTNDIKRSVKGIQEAFVSRDLVQFEAGLGSVREDLESLRALRDEKYKWAQKFPLTKNYYSDSEHFINAGLYAVSAGEEFTKLVMPFADAVGLKVSEEQVIEERGFAEAFSAWISVMPEVADQTDGVILELSKVGEELSYVNSKKYPRKLGKMKIRGTIEGAQQTLSELNDYAPDLKIALKVVPRLLGVGVFEKRYMIIFQNDAEIRATGGFWTFYSTFKVSDALLTSDFTSKDMYSLDFILDAIDPYHTFPKVPPAYERHLKVERMYARDANISPDFPTAIDQFTYFYDLAMNVAPYEIKPVDGFIAIDTKVISELLEVTGPVTVNGVTYTTENVVLELEKIASLSMKEQMNRKKVLGDLMEAMLVNVFESDKNLWPKLIEKGIDLANRKHILAYMIDPDAQALLEKYNFAGRIIDPVEGDFSYYVSTNLGGDKTNMFVKRVFEHDLKQEGSRWVRTLKISYHYEVPSEEYTPLATRFRDWFRYYVPAGSELISLEGSDEAIEQGDEMNKHYFAGHMTLGPGETHTVTVKYYLPDGVIDNGEYNLYLEKQPGVGIEIHKITANRSSEEVELVRDYKYSTTL